MGFQFNRDSVDIVMDPMEGPACINREDDESPEELNSTEAFDCPICQEVFKTPIRTQTCKHVLYKEEYGPPPATPVEPRAQPASRVIEIDVDGGRDQDIFDINEALGLDLVEGDILTDHVQAINSILGDEYRWPTTIPYYLEDSLDINAKGVILKAFEQYRLKTCIDYKPWEGEPNYIGVFKGNGCFSSVGNRRIGKQTLSIGNNCDRIATIEHEFLHALGFWHEQSRADRDDYVTIMWDRISEGKQHNFNKYSDTESSSLNVPYDYSSMMHYSKTAFMNGTEPTIVTRIPEFMDVIGQRMEFSDSDLLKVNRLYNCSSSLTFMEHCSFELENICGMIQGSGDHADWEHVMQVDGGPMTDYTTMGKCEGTGYFMHFSTATGMAGHKAHMESRILYPKRGFQCLQFFYYNNGNQNDELNIWVREYDEMNPEGMLRRMGGIQGEPQDYWQFHYLSLNVSKKFRVVFEGIKGAGVSKGGFSIDDINLSETQCPSDIWRIRNFTHLLATSPSGAGGRIYSPRFHSSEGYAFQIGLYVNGTNSNPGELAIYFHLASGLNDDRLQWPCPWMQITGLLLDQNPDIRRQMSNQRSVTTDPTLFETEADGSKIYFWDDPRKVGSLVQDLDGTKYYRGPGRGTNVFLTHDRLRSRNFIKGDDVIFLITMEDISRLTATQPLPQTTQPPATTSSVPTTPPASELCDTFGCENDGVCVVENGKPVCRCAVGKDWWFMGEKCQIKGKSEDTVIAAVSASVAVFAAMLLVTVTSVYCVKKKLIKKMQRQTPGIVMANINAL
ncbi:meprin A subunit beta-like [Polyodon spathula]|uniref:meprin A subunit beta-like n=1 Tax=Polyodon spathula TaxID=7913 RepID=UPI001B7E9543|nr:meprin A subunit beta-like [Polyodon spathula]